MRSEDNFIVLIIGRGVYRKTYSDPITMCYSLFYDLFGVMGHPVHWYTRTLYKSKRKTIFAFERVEI